MASARAGAVVERLMDDQYLHEQLAAGTAGARAAYRRARAMRGQQAVQDKKLYDHVRRSAAALTEAARRAAGKPKPEPKRRWRRLPVMLVSVAVAALVWAMHRTQQATTQPSPAP
jgi:hypothetical protein